MSGEDRLSRMAQEHKERQAQRAAEGRAAKSKRNAIIGAVVALAVVGGGVTAFAMTRPEDAGSNTAVAPPVTVAPDPSTSASASAEPLADGQTEGPKGPVTCDYKRDTSGVPQKFVGMPPARPRGNYDKMLITTNRGDIEIQLDAKLTPCSVNSMAFLAAKNFYDNTKCHRLVTPEQAGVFMLQCGDPKAKADGKNPTDGQGTAGYFIPDEAVDAVQYTRGVVFLTQPSEAFNQSSSQFAISLADENAQIGGGYTPIGMVTKGLEWMDKLDKEELLVNDGDVMGNDQGSTAPKNPIIIKNVRLVGKKA
ncbi:peptidylprolyl isomerase [Nonomuraea sp. NPDC050310]|uniref:peptidylprolyl isomerase n=1 Tax=unclassified Nonomuraea TaxID=2593643 RepID=UPI00340BF7A2